MCILKRYSLLIISSLSFLLLSCQANEGTINQFSSSSDTLVIKTTKHKGEGLFQLGATHLQLKDTSETFSQLVIYPTSLNDLKRLQLKVDFKEEDGHYIEIVKGIKDGKEVFIVDENNNKDFNDDAIREYKAINWDPFVDLIKCNYLISDGKQIVKGSSWLNIGDINGRFHLGRSEHLKAQFYIDDQAYEIGVIDPRNPLSFAYDVQPVIALLNDSKQEITLLSERNLLKKGEALNLKNTYYRFEKISNNGELLTLVKDKNFKTKVGTQIGMIAPEFKFMTISNDTIKSSSISDKLIIVANSCGCGGDIESTEAYYQMEKSYGQAISIIHMDSDMKKTDTGIHVDSEAAYNKDFKTNYRKEFCSRICYVIGKNNRIIDKFNINEWETTLPKIMLNMQRTSP